MSDAKIDTPPSLHQRPHIITSSTIGCVEVPRWKLISIDNTLLTHQHTHPQAPVQPSHANPPFYSLNNHHRDAFYMIFFITKTRKNSEEKLQTSKQTVNNMTILTKAKERVE